MTCKIINRKTGKIIAEITGDFTLDGIDAENFSALSAANCERAEGFILAPVAYITNCSIAAKR